MELGTKQFITILISLALTNANFYAMIKTLETKDSAQEKRIDKLENKIFGVRFIQIRKGKYS